MDQPKVFEFAKEVGMETLALMDKIREWNLPVKSHMAALSDELIEEIQSRLSEEQGKAQKKTKKVVTKKVAAKKATTKVTKKKVVAQNVVTKASPAAVKKKAVASSPSTKKVIRRKASELEAKATEFAEQEAIKQIAIQEKVVEARREGKDVREELTEIHVQSAAQENLTQQVAENSDGSAGTSERATPAERPRRTNIVGRMDLKRVSPAGAAGSGAGASDSQGARPSRTAPRNLRAGFLAEAPVFTPTVDDDRTKKKDDRIPAKKRAGAGAKEEEVQVFTATEFRKREVIFQPKKKKANVGRESKKTMITTPKASKRVVKVSQEMSVSELAQQLGIKLPQLTRKLMQEGVMATPTTALDFDTIALIVPEFGFEAQNVHQSVEEMLEISAFGDLDAEKKQKPPVVTVMGHVDHGKTSLLDQIRKAKVAAGEAGGITQHIGAYSVDLGKDRILTFLDTPGHEAFTAMRARGAHVTDIVIIVVAADDGVMPQTVEAINHAKASGVPIIVAVNKMDKPGANPDRVKQQLTEYQLIPEDWGGDTIYCHVSALTGDGVEALLEQVHVVAELAELKANPARSATGVVIESRMEKGRGPVATLLVQDGTLQVGQPLVAGAVSGRVRSLMNDSGKTVKEVGPGYPVEVMGLESTPNAGDRFDVCKSEEIARSVAEARSAEVEKAATPNSKMSIDDLFSKVRMGEQKEFSVVLKGDVAGSLEAIKGMFEKIGTDEVKVKVIHSAVGAISESDVLLASTASGLVIGFNVRPDSSAQRMAKDKSVDIRSYSVIYELVDDMKKALSGLLSPDLVEEVMGRAEIRETFSVPKVGTIAGCFVVDGKILRGNQVRLLRNGTVVYTGELGSLKRFKDDVKEVATGYECGIGILNYNDLKVGDEIEAFVKKEVSREL